ncbi:thioredoxin family protein [Gracilibacillus dipsosauri]|uniref:thioredoxin family protein n=1 Tax=Gracilibacillus dipsosauri TaxID=178340 RepID=UPI002408F986
MLLKTKACPKCEVVYRFLSQMDVPFQVIDLVDQQEMAESYKVMSVPTTILLDNLNRELNRCIGVNPMGLEEMVHIMKKGEESHV